MDGRSCSGSRDIKSISFEKLAMVRTFLKKPEGVDGSFEVRSGAGFDCETATTFPNLLEDIMMKLVPRLEAVKMQNFGSILP